MRTWLFRLALVFLLACDVRASVLFSDNFNRPDNSNISASSTGMGGSLAPLSYYQTSGATITGGTLQLGRGLPTGDSVFPDHNFTDPSIISSGGFNVSFNVTPTSSVDYTGEANWGAVSVGYARSDATSSGFKVAGANAFGVLVRGSGGTQNPGQIQMWEDGVDVGNLVFDQSPTPLETYQVTLTVTPTAGQSLFVANQTAEATVTITGDLNADSTFATFQTSMPFTWIGSSNYVVLEGILEDSSTDPTTGFDNLSIATLPDPSAIALCGLVLPLLLRRRRVA